MTAHFIRYVINRSISSFTVEPTGKGGLPCVLSCIYLYCGIEFASKND